MSRLNADVMKRKGHLPDDLFPVTGRKGKRARIYENQAITDANAVNSPLLRLPTEIRQIILRMVVGDKLIHLYSVFYDSSSEPQDSDEEGALQRSLCVADVARPCTPAASHAKKASPSSAKEAESCFTQIHADCHNLDRPEEFEYSNFSRIFRTSRHISREALHIFWHTNQFCFETAGALKNFLSTLKSVRKENILKHLVIVYPFGTVASSKWAQISAPSTLSALRGVATFELHIHLSGRMKAMSRVKEDRSTVIQERLEAFESLRLLNVKKVSVIISHGEQYFGKSLERGELETMADSLRQRLLDPVITPQEYLADSIRKLQRSLRNTEHSVRTRTNQIQDLRQKVDAGSLKAERTKVEIDELKALLQRNNTAEIEAVLQTDEGGNSSGGQ